jgi:phosphatidylglycerol---prolipoprotein diacylglyceryl transferase
MINYIIWNESPTLFSIGSLALRWYGVLFVAGFLLCRFILLRLYKIEGKPATDVESLAKYIFLAAIIGARLGYVLLYQPEIILSRPLEILLPIEFQPTFHFSGLDKLSSHGAIIGILIALWIYSRKGKPGQNYLQVLDRVAIVLVLACMFIGAGNFFNAEIIGKPTNSKTGVVFTSPITEGMVKIPCCIMRTPGGKNPLDFVTVKKDDALTADSAGRSPMILYTFFKPGANEQLVNEFLMGDVKTYLFDRSEFVYEPGTEPLHYTIFVEKDVYTARIRTKGIARHPVQLYESICCLIIFSLLYLIWKKYKEDTPSGRIFGFFFTLYWSLLFATSFLKENEVPLMDGFPVSIGQLLSITLVLVGVVVLAYSYKKTPATLNN